MAKGFCFNYDVRACVQVYWSPSWVKFHLFLRHYDREFILRDKQAATRWLQAILMETVEKKGAELMRCTFKLNIYCVYRPPTSMEPRINKCIFHSVSAFDTLILSEINIRDIHFASPPLVAYCHQRCFNFAQQSSKLWYMFTCEVSGHIVTNNTQHLKQSKERDQVIWNYSILKINLTSLKTFSRFFVFLLALHVSPTYVLDPPPISKVFTLHPSSSHPSVILVFCVLL